jgi:hypothetical protein
VSGLSIGPHTFSVAATDTSGNADPTPATWSWSVVAGPIFSDDFESGGPTAGGWTFSTGGGGIAEVVQGIGVDSSYGLHIKATTAKGSFAYAQKVLTAGMDLAVGFTLQVPTEGAVGKNTSILKVYDTKATRVLTLVRDNVTGRISVVDRAKVTTLTTTSIPKGTSWTRVVVHLVITSSSDTLTLLLDGAQALSKSVDLGSLGVGKFRLGNDSLRVATDLVFDNVEVIA